MRWALGRVATGVIAIGTTATSILTTTIISTGTRIGTLTEAKLARAIGGNTTRNIVGMPPMETGERRISLAREEEAKVEEGPVELAEQVVQEALAALAVRVASAELVVQVGLAVRVASAELVVPVELAVQVASAGPEDPAEPVVRVALVVSENPGVPVALERELGPVEAEPELVQVAVAQGTKSVTAALRCGLLAVLAVEDLVVAVAETTREPAAAGAEVAWAAEDTAVAAGVVAGAEE